MLATFAYNADDTRRYSTDGLNTYYHGDQAILDMDAAGGNNYALNKKLRRYVRLPGTVDEALLMIAYDSSGAETGRQYAHFNRLGSTVAVFNAAGAITEWFKLLKADLALPNGADQQVTHMRRRYVLCADLDHAWRRCLRSSQDGSEIQVVRKREVAIVTHPIQGHGVRRPAVADG